MRLPARDNEAGPWERRARRWLAEPWLQLVTAWGLFTVVATVSATQLYLNWTAAGFSTSYGRLVAAELVEWWMWAAAVPLIVAIHGRLTDRGAGWPRATVVHLLAATGVFAVQNTVLVFVTPLVDPAAQPDAGFLAAYLGRGVLRLSTGWVVYAFILGASWMVQEAVRRQSLTRDLYDAQLRALRAQMHPHFLFNTLHAAASLVRSGNRDQSIETLVALSELLRRSLNHARWDEVPLEEELEFLEIYLSIQRTRFGENLRIHTHVDEDVRGAAVPPLVLQPLVENAIRHGLDLSTEPGTISVVAKADGGALRIVVEDDGGRLDPGTARAGNGEGGIGLKNLEDRLVRLYGTRQSLTLERTDAGTTAVTVQIPIRR